MPDEELPKCLLPLNLGRNRTAAPTSNGWYYGREIQARHEPHRIHLVRPFAVIGPLPDGKLYAQTTSNDYNGIPLTADCRAVAVSLDVANFDWFGPVLNIMDADAPDY